VNFIIQILLGLLLLYLSYWLHELLHYVVLYVGGFHPHLGFDPVYLPKFVMSDYNNLDGSGVYDWFVNYIPYVIIIPLFVVLTIYCYYNDYMILGIITILICLGHQSMSKNERK